MVKFICFSHFVFFWNFNFRALGLSSKEVLDNYFGLMMHLFLGKGKLRLNCTSGLQRQPQIQGSPVISLRAGDLLSPSSIVTVCHHYFIGFEPHSISQLLK